MTARISAKHRHYKKDNNKALYRPSQWMSILYAIVFLLVLWVLYIVIQPFNNALTIKEISHVVQPYKLAVTECMQLRGGDSSQCNAGQSGIPTTKVVHDADISQILVSEGQIIVKPVSIEEQPMTMIPKWHPRSGHVSWRIKTLPI